MKKKGTWIFVLALLLAFGNCPAQKNAATRIQQTRIQLVLNQNKFSPGDTAWFKAYFLNDDLSPVPGKQVLELNLVDWHGKSVVHFPFTTTDGIGQNQLGIPDTLSAGIYLITAHSSWMRNFSPVPMFRKEIEIVRKNSLVRINGRTDSGTNINRPQRIHVLLTSDKPHYKNREKAIVVVSLTDSDGKPVRGEFSVSVVNAAVCPSDSTDLSRTLYPPENEDHETRTTDGTARPRYNFTTVLQKNGKAYLGDTNEPVPDFTQILFYLQRYKNHYQTFTSGNSKVSLTLPDIFGDDEFFYIAETKNGKEITNLKIEWDEEPLQLPVASQAKESDTPDPYAIYAARKKMIDRSFGFYGPASKGKGQGDKVLTGEFEDEIMGADITVRMLDYAVYPTMEELVKEVIPSLYHRKTGGKSMVRMNLESARPTDPPPIPTGDPVYVIDGIATKNTSYFLSLKPADLWTVKLVTDPHKLSQFQLMGKNGIVIVATRKGDAREPLTDPSKIIEGLNKPADRRVGSYSSSSDRHQPDFRSTLYWNPSIKTDATGKAIVEFFCSDDTGKMTIRIDGIAEGGRGFSTEGALTVDN